MLIWSLMMFQHKHHHSLVGRISQRNKRVVLHPTINSRKQPKLIGTTALASFLLNITTLFECPVGGTKAFSFIKNIWTWIWYILLVVIHIYIGNIPWKGLFWPILYFDCKVRYQSIIIHLSCIIIVCKYTQRCKHLNLHVAQSPGLNSLRNEFRYSFRGGYE